MGKATRNRRYTNFSRPPRPSHIFNKASRMPSPIGRDSPCNPYAPPAEDSAHRKMTRRSMRKLGKKLRSRISKERMNSISELSSLAKRCRGYRPDVAKQALKHLWNDGSVMANCALLDLGASGEDWDNWRDIRAADGGSDIATFILAMPSTIYLGCAMPESMTASIQQIVLMTAAVFTFYASASKIATRMREESFLNAFLDTIGADRNLGKG